MNFRTTVIGLSATSLYISSVAVISILHPHLFQGMKAEAWANFLAGVFAPLAFLWLVLGYFQQGKELRNSAEALRLQGEELKASVQQQKELVRVTRDQFEHDRQKTDAEIADARRRSRPIFSMISTGSSPSGEGNRQFMFRLTNAGASCSDVRVWRGAQQIGGQPRLGTGEYTSVVIIVGRTDLPRDEEVTVHYYDALMLPDKQSFTLQVLREGSGMPRVKISPAPSTDTSQTLRP